MFLLVIILDTHIHILNNNNNNHIIIITPIIHVTHELCTHLIRIRRMVVVVVGLRGLLRHHLRLLFLLVVARAQVVVVKQAKDLPPSLRMVVHHPLYHHKDNYRLSSRRVLFLSFHNLDRGWLRLLLVLLVVVP